MNSPKMMIAALLISGMAMSAKETLQFKTSDASSSNSSSIFKNRTQPRNILKLNTSAFTSSSAREWEEAEVTGGGFFLNLGLHFPSSKFLNPDDNALKPKYGLGFDFEFGNYFRFAKLADEKVGIGLRATWVSVSYVATSVGSDRYRVIQLCPVKIGPQVGVAINETMGVDLFYQLGFNLTEEFGSIDDPLNSKNVGQSSTYVGLSHEIGAAYHFKVLSFGLGYRFGRLKNTLNYYDGKDLGSAGLDDAKSSIGNFRITLGVKF